MLEVINLALQFFGLIFLGLGCGKFKALPDAGLAWMDFFILYVALPALFYRIVAQTPLEQLANPRFIVGTMLATFSAFAVSFAIGMVIRRGQMAEATIAGLAGGYGNIGIWVPASLWRRSDPRPRRQSPSYSVSTTSCCFHSCHS